MALELVLAGEAIGAAIIAAERWAGEYLDIWIGAMFGGAMPGEVGPSLGAEVAPFDVAMELPSARCIDRFEMASFVDMTIPKVAVRAFRNVA